MRSSTSPASWGFLSVRYVVLVLMLGFVGLPFIFAVSVAFRPPTELFANHVYLIPKNPTIETWINGFNNLKQPLMNSVIIATGTMVISLFITIPGAYVFGRKDFPGKDLAFYAIVLALLLPYILLIIPMSALAHRTGLYNTIPGLWIAYQTFVTPFSLWILRDFFESLPSNLEEAAQVYGCTQFSAFVRVMLPISGPAIVAVGFLAFLTGWNDFLFSNYLTTGTGPRPAVVTLYLSTLGGERTYWGLLMAQTLIIGIPPTVLYMFSRRYLSQAFALS